MAISVLVMFGTVAALGDVLFGVVTVSDDVLLVL